MHLANNDTSYMCVGRMLLIQATEGMFVCLFVYYTVSYNETSSDVLYL